MSLFCIRTEYQSTFDLLPIANVSKNRYHFPKFFPNSLAKSTSTGDSSELLCSNLNGNFRNSSANKDVVVTHPKCNCIMIRKCFCVISVRF